MLVKATSHSGGTAPWTPFNFRACYGRVFNTKKTDRSKKKGPFYSSGIFSRYCSEVNISDLVYIRVVQKNTILR